MYHVVMSLILLFPWAILAGLSAVNLGRRHRQVKVRAR